MTEEAPSTLCVEQQRRVEAAKTAASILRGRSAISMTSLMESPGAVMTLADWILDCQDHFGVPVTLHTTATNGSDDYPPADVAGVPFHTDGESIEFTRMPSPELMTLVGEGIGEASVCWENMSGTGVFDSDRACRVRQRILDAITEELNR